MAFWHSAVGRILAIADIGKNIRRSHRTGASKRRLENSRVAGHRKFLECLAGRARKRIQRVRFAFLIQHIVEKCAELRVTEFNPGIGDHLHQTLQVVFGRDCNADLIECIQRVALLARLHDAGFQRLVERQQPGLKGLAFGDVINRAAHDRLFAGGPLAPCDDPAQTVL